VSKVRLVRFRGEAGSYAEADALIDMPGDVAFVKRGHLRAMIISCPDGCGEVITTNLDPAAGPAWTLYRRRRGITLVPSIFRESGCRSHFIIWNDGILWCDDDEWDYLEPNREIDARILDLLRGFSSFRTIDEIARDVDEVPWLVSSACKRLTQKGLIIQRPGKNSRSFRLTRLPSR